MRTSTHDPGGVHALSRSGSPHVISPLLATILITLAALLVSAMANDELDKMLRDAARDGKTETVEKHVRDGAEVNSKGYKGFTALILASMKGHPEIVEFLLSKGADPNMKNDDGQTALMWAAANGHLKIMKLLIAAKADINYKDQYDMGAYEWARDNGEKKAMELLKGGKGSD